LNHEGHEEHEEHEGKQIQVSNVFAQIGNNAPRIDWI
jgi:hypothetical protein